MTGALTSADGLETASRDYANAAHNVLRKCIQLDLMRKLEQPSETMDFSGVAGYLLRGSNSLLASPEKSPIPRNPRDMDLVVLGTPGYRTDQAECAVYHHIEETAKSLRAQVVFTKVGENHYDSVRHWVGKRLVMPVVVGHGLAEYKRHGYVSKEFTPKDIREILNSRKFYALSDKEIDTLKPLSQGMAANNVTLEMDINLGLPFLMPAPVKPISNEPLVADALSYRGIYINERTKDLAEKLHTVNMRWKNVPEDQGLAMTLVSLYNIYHRRFGGELDAESIADIRKNGLQSNDSNSRFQRYDHIVAKDWKAAVNGLPKNRISPLTEEKIDKLQAIYDDAYNSNLLLRKLERKDVREILTCTLDLSQAILGKNKPLKGGVRSQ